MKIQQPVKKPIETLRMGTWTTAQNKARSLLLQGYKPQIILEKSSGLWKIEVYD